MRSHSSKFKAARTPDPLRTHVVGQVSIEASLKAALGALLLSSVACACSSPAVKESGTAQHTTHTSEKNTAVKPSSTLTLGSSSGSRDAAASASVAVPQDYQTLRSLLLAREAENLPDKATLQRHSNAVEALTWLGRNDDQLVVRARALNVLGYFSSADVRSTLLSIARDAQQPSKARAGAVEGLARQNPGEDAALQGALLELVKDKDIRVGVAAVEALSGIASARQGLEALARAGGLSSDVQRALERALK